MTPLTKLLVESREEFKEKCSYDGVEIDGDVDAFIDSLVRKAYLLGLERAKEVISPITPDRKNGLSILKDPLVPIPKDKRMSVAIGYQQAKVDAEKALDSAIGEVTE